MTQQALAESLGIPLQRTTLIVNGKRGITAETALSLAREFKTTPEFWMNLQASVDLYAAREEMLHERRA